MHGAAALTAARPLTVPASPGSQQDGINVQKPSRWKHTSTHPRRVPLRPEEAPGSPSLTPLHPAVTLGGSCSDFIYKTPSLENGDKNVLLTALFANRGR